MTLEHYSKFSTLVLLRFCCLHPGYPLLCDSTRMAAKRLSIMWRVYLGYAGAPYKKSKGTTIVHVQFI